MIQIILMYFIADACSVKILCWILVYPVYKLQRGRYTLNREPGLLKHSQDINLSLFGITCVFKYKNKVVI